MGLNRKYEDKTIFLDTAPLIYYIEENKAYANLLNELFTEGENRTCRFISSIITLIEVLTLPLREQNKELAEKYEEILTHSGAIEIVDTNSKIAKMTAQLRADYSLKTPDAIQLATAIYSSANYFLTNDKRLKMVSEINVVTIDELI
jgi:predicted nucleic acid-binding protein